MRRLLPRPAHGDTRFDRLAVDEPGEPLGRGLERRADVAEQRHVGGVLAPKASALSATCRTATPSGTGSADR